MHCIYEKPIEEMRQSKEKFLLYSGACAALLPTLLLRDFTPANELRYLSIADEALRNHTFFAFTNHGIPYADKPPLYFWIIMLCKWMAGCHKMWLLSLFSLLPALSIIRMMDKWTVPEADWESRSLARIILLTCGLFLGAAFILRMDMLMCMFIVLSLHSFWRMMTRKDKAGKEQWLFPLWIFLAVFTKGPIGLLVPLASTVVFLILRRRTKEIPRYWGWRTLGVLSVYCLLWFTAIYAEGGSGYLYDLLFQQTAGRAVNSFHHAEPFYYYGLSIWYCLAPWSLLIVGVIAASLSPKFVRTDLQCFFLCIGITSFMLLSCISSKLEIYMLPALPFLIYAAAMSLSRFHDNIWMRIALTVPSAGFSLALPAIAILAQQEDMPYLNEGLLYAVATILTLTGAYSLYLLYMKQETDAPESRQYRIKRQADNAQVIKHLGAGMLIALFVGGWTWPKLNTYTGYGTLFQNAQELSKEYKIKEIRTWDLPRSENMDIYMRHTVDVIQTATPPVYDGKPFLLLTKKDNLKVFQEQETHTTGKYAIVVFRERHNNNNAEKEQDE